MGNSSRTPMRILLIDDDGDVCKAISDFLGARGHVVIQTGNGTSALSHLRESPFDIVITDIKLPGADGFDILAQVKEQATGAEVIMMTGFGDIDIAVRAMREGAFDFFSKPVKMQELVAAIERTERFHVLRKERDQAKSRLNRLSDEARRRHGLVAFVGGSAEVQAVKSLVEQVCRTDSTSVLLSGETGTGKEVIARAIHHESARADGPFVAVDCTAIPATLFESVFYGYEKGAFTDARESRQGYFEQAHGGTLFLDEIGDMPPDMQARLLRTLEERRIRRLGGSREISVDVRVVSATHQDLTDAIGQGRFRSDLYHRINTFIIHLPPLRDRPGDILLLARHFLDYYAREMRKDVRDFAPDVLNRLQAHPFPGNVRELKNTIERAVILCQTHRLSLCDLQFTTVYAPASGSSSGQASLDLALQALPDQFLNVAHVEVDLIREALRRCHNNKGAAADMLGMSRFALRRRLASHRNKT